jgi:PAS domain S-box-containing protein
MIAPGLICNVAIMGSSHADLVPDRKTGRFEALLSSAADGIIIIREDGMIETVNRAAARLFGYAVDEFVGRNVKFLMPDTDEGRHDSFLRSCRSIGRRATIGIGREVTGRRKDGSVFPLHLSVGGFEEGGTRFFTGIIRDLTRRKQAEEALRQVRKIEAVGRLTGGLAHDFNNLLAVIIGNLELLGTRVDLGPDATLLDETLKAADLAAGLTARLLDFARRSPLQPKRLRPAEVILGIAPLLDRALGAKVRLAVHLAEDGWPVCVDPDEFQTALLNLAINGRDAMPGEGLLVIETRNFPVDCAFLSTELGLQPGLYAVLSISDTGRGMPADVIERVFEPFFTTRPPGQGTGLGMSIVHGFIKQSGGEIVIYSEQNLGTTVNLFLPGSLDPGQAMTKAGQEPIPAPRDADTTVLVVEDNDQVRRLTRTRLEALGYQVREAAHGPAAVELLAAGPKVDLVFSDLVIPGGMTGYDVARHVRTHYPQTRVLLTSGYAEDLTQGDKLAAHDLRLLRKPYRQAALAAAIRDVLSQGGVRAG